MRALSYSDRPQVSPRLVVCVALIGGLLNACGGAAPKPKDIDDQANAPAPDPSARPAVAPLADAPFPQPKVFTVTSSGAGGEAGKGGVTLLVVEKSDLPTVFIRWVFPGGRVIEFAGASGPQWPEGTVDLTAEMLTEGTRKHRGTAFAAALSSHGAQLGFSALADAVVASGQVLSHQVRPYMELVREAVVQPEFGSTATSSLKKRWQAQLANLATRPRSIAARIFNRAVYGERHPYGSPGPTAESIGSISARHMQAAHRAALQIPGSTLIAVGDVKADAFAALLRDVFGAALDGDGRDAVMAGPPTPLPPACHMIDVPGAVQTVITTGNAGPPRASKDWAAATLANQVLGGSASSRLFTVLRERKGLTYGIYSSLDGRAAAGDWSLSTSVRTPKTDEAMEAIGQELALIRSQEPRPDELTAAKRKLAGGFLMSLSRGAQVAARLATERLYALPSGYWGAYVGKLQGVTAPDARAQAGAHFGVGGTATVLVGNIAAIRPAVDRFCPRIVRRDASGKQLEVVVGGDDEMLDASRDKAFALWAGSDAGLAPLAMYVVDTNHKANFRADALAALLETGRHHQLRAIGGKAKDWDKLAVHVLDRLTAAFKLVANEADLKRAYAAHEVLLDLVEPPDRDETILNTEVAGVARRAIAAWAFAGVTPDTRQADVALVMKRRLVPGDLVRLGEPSIPGLEALVSTSVMRVEAARALRLLETSDATRALLRGYRRAIVERRELPDEQDLEVLGSMPGFATALLLFDSHALHRRAKDAKERAAAAVTMDTLRRVFDDMASEKSTEPRDRDAGRSVLQRDFDRFVRSLEAVLGFSNADDRWWAATQLIRNKGIVGLRLVLHGLRDDDNYGDKAFGTIDPKLQIGDLCRNEITPLGRRKIQHILLAALAGRHRVAKIIAITALKAFGDVGSLTALKTHRDPTDIAKILALPGHVSVTRLAQAAVDVHTYMDEIDAAVKAGTVPQDVADLHKELAYYTYDLIGIKLRQEVARRVRERLPAAAPTAKAQPAPGPAPSE